MIKLFQFAYSIVLICLSIVVWSSLYKAGFLPYDENWGYITTVLFFSILVTISIIILWFTKRSFIINCKWQTILYFVIASPFTIIIVCMLYTEIFGRNLQV